MLPTLLVVAAMGPMLISTGSIRTEHVVIYALFPFAMMVIALRGSGAVRAWELLAIVAVFGLVLFWSSVVTFTGVQRYPSILTAIAGAEGELQPIAIVAVLAAFTRPRSADDAAELLRKVLLTIVIVLVANSILILASFVVDTAPILQLFIPSDASGFSVGRNSLLRGRLFGVFNQPGESGGAYTIGLFAWLYLIKTKSIARWFADLSLVMLVLGGFFSVSKLFLLVGLPLAFLSWWMAGGSLRQQWRVLLLMAVAIVLGVSKLQDWAGWDLVSRLIFPQQDAGFLSVYTAGRFGSSDATYEEVFRIVWRLAPFAGMGFGGLSGIVPYDSEYTEFYATGGVLGIAGLLLIVVLLGWAGVRAFQFARSREAGRLLITLAMFAGVGAIGSPVLTANRSSILLWTAVTMTLVYVRLARREAATVDSDGNNAD